MDITGERPVAKQALLSTLPPEWPKDPFPEIQRRVHASGRKVVVLDDDPTGTQTAHDLWVLTHWTSGVLRFALTDKSPTFYVLTNSRSLSQEAAIALNQEIAANLTTTTNELGCDFDLVSRSDSTLRGHFPAEVDALQAMLRPCLGRNYDGIIICPFFLEGGRLTAYDVHWVAEGDTLTPAGLTEFARDATFGYTKSNLRGWIEEKTAGRVRANEVLSISLEVIRQRGPSGVRGVLEEATDGRMVVANALSYRDMAVLIAGLLDAEESGKRFLFRTAASFVKVRGGIPDHGLLTAAEMVGNRPGGGLVVVGSYVDKTTRQLHSALALPGVSAHELNVGQILDPASREAEVERVTTATYQALAGGQEALVYTSRDLVTERGRAGELDIGQQVSSALVDVVQRIDITPRFIIAKGGITSSDVATDGLGVERAWVLGQILPGIPVWRLGDESRFPGLPYVVFPGNVGTDDSLAESIQILRS
jgi:uncharacterized protein YgbK (DUF1537 family)